MRRRTLEAVVAVLSAFRRPVSSKVVAEELGISQRTVQRYLRALEERGFVEAVREGREVRYVLVKPLTRSDLEELMGTAKALEDEPAYELARKALELLRDEGGVPADLIGAAKVRLLFPERHKRVTYEIELVVLPELFRASLALLKYGLGLLAEEGPCGVKLFDLRTGVRITLMKGKVCEDGKAFFDASKPLRGRGSLSLEEAVAIMMLKSSFSKRNEAYDVATALPGLDEGRWREALEEAKSLADPSNLPNVLKSIEVVREFVEEEVNPVERPYLLLKLDRIRKAAEEAFR